MRSTQVVGFVPSILVTLLVFSTATAQVCRLSRISGLEQEYDRGKSAVGTITSKMEDCRILVMRSHQGIYAHSNFKTPGYDYPTKIYTRDTDDLELLTDNIVFAESPGLRELQEYEAAKQKITYLLDRSVFNNDGSIALNLGSARNLFAKESPAEGTAWQRLVDVSDASGTAHSIGVDSGFYGPVTPSSSPRLIIDVLRSTKISKNTAHVLNLVADSATNESLQVTGIGARFQDGSAWPARTITEQLGALQGKIAIVLSHLEDGHCIITDLAGGVVERVPIQSLQKTADEHGVTLLLMGCESADHARFGMIRPINSVEFAGRIARSLEAENYYEFFKSLSGDDLAVLIPIDVPIPGKTTKFSLVREHRRVEGGKSGSLLDGGTTARIVFASYRHQDVDDDAVVDSITTVASVYLTLPDETEMQSAAQVRMSPSSSTPPAKTKPQWIWYALGGVAVVVGAIIAIRVQRG
ncbi:MAG: hypothetical protein KJZ69_01905 [Phycisphaerales bacterium]|nr:hypothetical protein [Phycisphaerales bacterium]